MKDNLETIRKLPLVISVKRVIVTKELENMLGKEFAQKAKTNEKKIFAYRFLYKSKGKKIRGFLIEPKRGKNLPCIIWNRGGNRDFGAIKLGQLFLDKSLIAPFAIEGYVVIATQYPGVGGGEGIDKQGSDDDLATVLDLKKILNAYPRANAKMTGMYGHSRGGMMTYMALREVRWIKAAVIGSAPVDEINAQKFRKGWDNHQKRIYGGSIFEKKRRSAILWAGELPKKRLCC